MKKGFTLIELLIVVAIIAILAAIAVPNFLEAQVRSKVSRVKADQRSLATGIEAYYLDNNAYPTAATNTSGQVAGPNSGVQYNPTGAGNVNIWIAQQSQPGNTNAIAQLGSIWSFSAAGSTRMSMITTPVSYVTSVFPDPFMDTKGATFGYFVALNSAGWVLWSPGPDTDQATGTNFGINTTSAITGSAVTGSTVETLYDIGVAQPSPAWALSAGASNTGLTYDPTNGTISRGDVARFKQ